MFINSVIINEGQLLPRVKVCVARHLEHYFNSYLKNQ